MTLIVDFTKIKQSAIKHLDRTSLVLDLILSQVDRMPLEAALAKLELFEEILDAELEVKK